MFNPFVIALIISILVGGAMYAYDTYSDVEADDNSKPVFVGLAAGCVALLIGLMTAGSPGGASGSGSGDVMYEAFES